MPDAEVIVVGGGILGLATAWHLCQPGGLPDDGRGEGTSPRRSSVPVIVLEKEPRLAAHQTGRNSGVIHSGIYYKPGSLKATTCRRGKAMLEAFCRERNLPWETCGKVIVATEEAEVPRLTALHQRGQDNGVVCRRIDRAELSEREPHVAGIAALHVPETGIVDYVAVCRQLATEIEAAGGKVILGGRVHRFLDAGAGVVAETSQGEWTGRYAVACGGLHSDRIARASGLATDARIVPFRGEYFDLAPDAVHLCKNLIYPVPDPAFPFLGVHFTRMIGGGVECGPNAVLAFGRESYRFRNINPRDVLETFSFPGFRRLGLKHWRMGLGEIHRSLSKPAFVRALSRLIPEIRSEHLRPAEAGVRAQAVGPDGQLVDDFLIATGRRQVHVLNAPSPAATASLEIGRIIAEKVRALA